MQISFPPLVKDFWDSQSLSTAVIDAFWNLETLIDFPWVSRGCTKHILVHPLSRTT